MDSVELRIFHDENLAKINKSPYCTPFNKGKLPSQIWIGNFTPISKALKNSLHRNIRK